jgi:hypothetical protein
MTIPTPTMLATRPVAIRTVVDTRCGATRVSGKQVATCSRHGEHTRHVDCRQNVAWEGESK